MFIVFNKKSKQVHTVLIEKNRGIHIVTFVHLQNILFCKIKLQYNFISICLISII